MRDVCQDLLIWRASKTGEHNGVRLSLMLSFFCNIQSKYAFVDDILFIIFSQIRLPITLLKEEKEDEEFLQS